MAITIGQRIGSYTVLSLIGGGGMGEVYRARDTQLERDVALKLLPDAFASDPERLARFQREAQLLASLNHPNIAVIHGLEDSKPKALVLELVEGPTLAERVAQGPIPVEEFLPIAKQIADALEYAHEHAVMHRDLKPANIKLKRDGTVKVLDFGLAKALNEGTKSPVTSNSPTLSLAATQAGVILGTAAYMPPEQAKGKEVDRRADIWSFGVVLYEMLTGKMAFSGETVSETMAFVMTKEPDWDVLPKNTPRRLRELLRRCLVKDPKNRLRDIGDARLAIQDVIGHPEMEVAKADISLTSVVPKRRTRETFAWALALTLTLIAALLASTALVHFRERTPQEHTLRYALAAPEGSVHSFAISPDGRYVAIAAMANGKLQLWLRPLDALQAQPMPSTEDAIYPFWSPDSRYIGFFAQGKLKKIAASGGPAQSLCDVTGPRGGSWSRDDVILFSESGGNIQRVTAAGGVPADVFKTKGVTVRYPVFLPDGRHFLSIDIRSTTTGIYVNSLDGIESRRVLPDRSGAVYAPSSPGSRAGYLLFVRENNLMALPFDAAAVHASGDVFPIAEGVSISQASPGYAPVTISENGVLLYGTGNAGGGTQTVWYNRTGKLLGTVGAPGNLTPSISPDEKVVAFSRAGGGSFDIWLRDLVRATDTRFTAGGVNFAPSWSPKGDRIVFTSAAGGAFGTLYQKAAGGSGPADPLLSSTRDRSDQWSRDGRFIVYTRDDPKTKQDVWVLPVAQAASTDRKPVPFLQTEFNEFQGQLSPDSRWMAYTSDESGQREVYVRPFPLGEGKWKISTAGGAHPRWQGDGKELFYVAPDGKMNTVAVKAVLGPQPSFEPGVPVPLFDSHMLAPGTVAYDVFQYDVTADGKRFLVVATGDAPTTSSPPLTVVVDWIAGLKK